MNTVEVTILEYHELDALVQKNLGFGRYEFVAVEMGHNDTDYYFPETTGALDEHEKEQIEAWKNGKFVPNSTTAILDKLCSDGVIEPGNYMITVMW